MNYTIVIGAITVVSSFLIIFFTSKKEKQDKHEADDLHQSDVRRIQDLDSTIVKLNLQASEQAREHAKELAGKSDSIADAQRDLLNKSADVISMQEDLQERSDKLREKYEQLNKLQKEMINQLTGGGSVPLLEVPAYAKTGEVSGEVAYPSKIGFVMTAIGDYPLTNVRIECKPEYYRILKDKADGKLLSMSSLDWLAANEIINVPAVTAETSAPILRIFLYATDKFDVYSKDQPKPPIDKTQLKPFNIRVRWGTFTYAYTGRFKIISPESFRVVSQTYFYKMHKFNSPAEFKDFILKEIAQRKKED